MSMVSLTPEEAISIRANLGNQSPFDCFEDDMLKGETAEMVHIPTLIWL